MDQLSHDLDSSRLAEFLHDSLKPFEDPVQEIQSGIEFALSGANGGGGFITLAWNGDSLAGALVMIPTGMDGYVPPNLLLYVAVRPDMRGRGIGGLLIKRSLERCKGAVKLHVEYDNPARRLYERLGFSSAYAEMRKP